MDYFKIDLAQKIILTIIAALLLLAACNIHGPEPTSSVNHWCPTVPDLNIDGELVERCDLCEQEGGRVFCPEIR